MRPIRVVVLCGVGPFGGASRSLYEVLRALPRGRVDVRIIAAAGTAVRYHQRVATDVVLARGISKLDHTKYSYYRGLRWIVLLRELFFVPFTISALVRARIRWGPADVVHANEITEIIPLLFARRLFNAAAITHVRSLQSEDGGLWRTRWVGRLLRKSVAAVIAIDENVRATLPADLRVDVIHNSFAAEPPQEVAGMLPQLAAASPYEELTVGFVGNLLRVKGLLDLVEAAALVRSTGRRVRYLVVGGSTRETRGLKHRLLTWLGLAQDVKAEFEAALMRHDMADAFVLLGHTDDVAAVYRQMDVLCFPSHLDAPGRPVFEAALLGVPSIVAVRNPRPDTLRDGVTGIAFEGRDVVALARAIEHLHDHPDVRRRMGSAARELATQNFTPASNAQRLLELYERVSRRGGSSGA